MARIPRHQLNDACLRPGTLYHVTNRGAGRRDIFSSPQDRLVFLSALADACCRYGLLIHAYCLMSNHVHLLVEDVRGCLSQAMSLTQSVYARYFNDARGERGAGHLFGDRFFCEVISSPDYYDRLVSYILVNPLRCTTPLAPSAEAYQWSSAALHCSSLAPSSFFACLLEQHGGADALLAAMPRPSTPEVVHNRRARFEALVESEWMSSDAARFGRTPSQMRDVLRRRARMPRPEPCADAAGEFMPPGHREAACRSLRAAAPFVGAPLAAAAAPLRDACAFDVPADEPVSTKVLSYLLWRFCAATQRQIACMQGRAVDEVARAVTLVRQMRTTSAAWEAALWRLEWRLRWRLECGPHRA